MGCLYVWDKCEAFPLMFPFVQNDLSVMVSGLFEEIPSRFFPHVLHSLAVMAHVIQKTA